jgi:SAM-dependent methyltransferase
MVLNLSAGASAVRYPNVIELEYSVFASTDVIGDVHQLPFHDEVFEAVVCLNAFEHYREPDLAMDEVRRVLKPGGRLFLHTAFLQPLHEAPHHYYNCTEFGLKHWLRKFDTQEIRVSENFNPAYVLSWLASDMEFEFRNAVSEEAAELFNKATMQEFSVFWRDPASRSSELWTIFQRLPLPVQRRFAAGWEAVATKT